MVWVIFLLIVILVIILAFAFPKFLKTLMILLGVLVGVLVCIGIIWYVVSQRDYQREEALSKERISVNEVELKDLSLHYSYWWKLTGRIKNNSKKYTLVGYRIKIKMRDCIKPGDCEVVGENTVDCVGAIVPPEQSRNIDGNVHFSGLDQKPRGKYEWDYSVVEIRGRP